MPGNLPNLAPAPGSIEVQRTTLSLDALGRYICSTWDEALGQGGAPFAAVVVGSGMYGAYCAQKLWRLGQSKGLRVLVLEAGPFLVSEHVQNLARIGLNVPGAIAPSADPLAPRELVWGLPWRGNQDFPGQAFCVGGKSLYWGGWCPRLTDQDLAGWPDPVATYLRNNYLRLEREIGVSDTTDFIAGALRNALKPKVRTAAAAIPEVDHASGLDGVEEAPLAVQGASPASGLFSFDKYSSGPLLVDSLREDCAAAGYADAARRLFLVPRAQVRRLELADGRVGGLKVLVDGAPKTMHLPPGCQVVIAAGTIESTRLALWSFGNGLMGRNLMAHLRSNFVARLKRGALAALPAEVQTTAFLVRGATALGRFHLQLTASTHPAGSDELLFRMVPDLDLLDAILSNQDPEWISVTVRGIAEMRGERTAHSHDPARSWLNLSPFESEGDGMPRAWVNLAPHPADLQLWGIMDRVAVELLQRLAGPGQLEFHWDGAWQSQPPPLNRPFPAWREGLGTTYHEAGTLWMGTDPAASVTDLQGRFHQVANAYACDQSLYPTVGSANPVLTGLVLARRLAEHLVAIA